MDLNILMEDMCLRLKISKEDVIDAIINETELKKYCSEKQLAYKHFYDIQIDDVNVMDYFRNLFNSCDIHKFMSEGYRYVVENKQLLW